MRILHVGWAMTRGGFETWLTRVMRHIDRERYQFDFLVHTHEEAALDGEIRALGSRVISVAGSIGEMRRVPGYSRHFMRAISEYGPYDAVQSHVQLYSGNVLRLAERAGIPIRIAHIHGDVAAERAEMPTRRGRIYHDTLGRMMNRHSNLRLACSRSSAEAAYGKDWQKDKRTLLLYQGIDLDDFRHLPDREGIRHELGIPGNAFVIGHIGRFAAVKNHSFLLDVAAEAVRFNPDARLLLVGDGPLRPSIEARVRGKGLSGRTVLTGLRADTPHMLSAMDALALPSRHEGLPMVLVEAQAAGLPCIISDTLPDDGVIVKPLVRRVSLRSPASSWARELLEAPALPSRAQCIDAIAGGPFDIVTGVRRLERIYESAANASAYAVQHQDADLDLKARDAPYR